MMAILKGIISRLNGSAGNLTFRTRANSTIVSEKVTVVVNRRTTAQQRHRMKWANIVQMYKGIAPLLNCGFENKAPMQSDYNLFMKANMQQQPVYLTKAEVSAGACVVAPYLITQGSLPAIATSGEGASRVTDIKLGSLQITASTTVAQFSNAVVQNNAHFNYGDQIAYFTILQKEHAQTGVPYAQFRASAVVLSRDNDALLWSLVHQAGFESKGGYLAHGADEGNGAYAWVHSRSKNGRTLVSTQQLLDHNTLLADYTSEEAYARAVATYGGESNNFLTPGEAGNSQVDNSTGDSGNGSGGSDSGSDGGGTDDGDDDNLMG